ncbi:transposase [Streptomyces ipomoeae]|uniref:transposase n=1 Tax=Streptomyces ipomoeae TaxID=103232 RepID=UPI0011473C71|nr:transposase [Streptomyces ipomoeae]MDX2937674.1 transposase [Streptomyces ipomoeae]TQE22772.1 hypothetical protein SipoB123_21555 [Streptomyces ipomoeae]
MMLMALVETGTRGLLGAVFGPNDKGESAYACLLLDRLTADTLVLADRAFDGNDFLTAVSRTGAQFLIRTKSSRRPPVLIPLPDGSFLTRIAGLKLRVIDADITVTTVAGQHVQGRYRLLTTLLDHRTAPAELLIAGRGIVPASDDIDMVGDIGRAVLADLLPPRRLRTSIRKVKCPISRDHEGQRLMSLITIYSGSIHSPRRIQKRLGYLSPIEFEEKHYASQATAEPVNLKPRKPVLTS